MVFFSELKDRTVLDSNGNLIGNLVDMIFVDGEKYAPISHIIYVGDDKYRKKVSWEMVKELAIQPGSESKGISIMLNKQRQELNPKFEDEKEFLVSSLLDKQIIDVDGLKVVRVNDIQLAKVDKFFSIVGVCVGTKSMLRRLGFSWLTKFLIPRAREKTILWESVESLDKELHTIHVKMKRSKIGNLHPSEIVDIMEDLSQRERTLIFNALDADKAAKTLAEAGPEIIESFFKDIKTHRIISILEHMSPDHAADIISVMPDEQGKHILEMMGEESRHKIKEILNYPEESAGALMRTDYIAIPSEFTAQKVINLIRQTKPSSEMMYRLYVVDRKHHLLGVLTIRALLLAEPEQQVTLFMKQNIIKVKVDSRKEDIARALSKYNLFVLPVVDALNTLKGVVTADDVLTELIPKSWKKRGSRLRRYRYGQEPGQKATGQSFGKDKGAGLLVNTSDPEKSQSAAGSANDAQTSENAADEAAEPASDPLPETENEEKHEKSAE
jgi:magnesium transporter